MSDIDLAALLELADSYAPEMTYAVTLDRDLKFDVQRAAEALNAARRDLDQALYAPRVSDGTQEMSGQTLGDDAPTAHLEERVADRERKLAEAEEAARPKSLALVFQRRSAREYEALMHQHTDKRGDLNRPKLGDALLNRCYLRTETADGQDANIDLDRALRPLDAEDLGMLRLMIIGHHTIGSTAGFNLRPSGQPATS